MNLLARLFTDFRLTHEHSQGAARQDGARKVMEFLLKVARLPAGVVEEMRSACGYIGRDLEKIRADWPGHEPGPPVEYRADRDGAARNARKNSRA